MNVFFYSRKSADCDNGCLYYTCPERCITMLRRIPVLRDLVIMSDILHSAGSLKAIPKSGDLVFLYIATCYELEELITMYDLFEPYRIILVLGAGEFAKDYRFHQLKPRYIATMDVNIPTLEKVVNKMLKTSSYSFM